MSQLIGSLIISVFLGDSELSLTGRLKVRRSRGVSLPEKIAEAAGLYEGQRVRIRVEEGRIVI